MSSLDERCSRLQIDISCLILYYLTHWRFVWGGSANMLTLLLPPSQSRPPQVWAMATARCYKVRRNRSHLSLSGGPELFHLASNNHSVVMDDVVSRPLVTLQAPDSCPWRACLSWCERYPALHLEAHLTLLRASRLIIAWAVHADDMLVFGGKRGYLNCPPQGN